MHKHSQVPQDQTQSVMAAWALLFAISRQMNMQAHDHRVMRAFAIEIVKQQPHQDRVMIGDQTLIKFPTSKFDSKAAYLHHHSQPHVWGEDAIMFPAIEALGFQPVMHLQGTHLPPYTPFTQQFSDTPPAMHIVNYGAKTGGFHWELKGQRNAGGGDCMYHTMGQQVAKHATQVAREIPEVHIQEAQKVLAVSYAAPTAEPFVPPMQQVRADNVVTREVKAAFKYLDKDAEERFENAEDMLAPMSIKDLLAVYKHLRDKVVGNKDTYLQRKPFNCDTNVMERAILGAKNAHESFSDDELSELKIDLVHALSKEAWRSEESFVALQKLDVSALSQQETASQAKSCGEEARETEANLGEFTHSPPRVPRLGC